MKVLVIHTLFDPEVIGGAEVVIQRQVQLLLKQGHEVEVATLDAAPGVRREIHKGVPVWRCHQRNFYHHYRKSKAPSLMRLLWHSVDRYNPFTRVALARILNAFCPDVVWCHNLSGWSISAWNEIRKHKIPIVQILHDQYFLCPNSNMFRGEKICNRPCIPCRILRVGHRRASRKVNMVVGVSQFVLDRQRSHGMFAGVPAQVLPNVRDSVMPAVCLNKQKDGKRTFGYIGGLTPAKGIGRLLEIYCSKPRPGHDLVVAGKGNRSYEEELRGRYEPRGVRFLGFVPSETFYKSIDILVVPSLWHDTLPTVVFEAHAHGIPVLGSRRGGIPEIIQEGVNGWLFEPDARENFDQWLERLATIPLPDPNEVHRTAMRFYDAAQWIQGFEDICAQALSGHRDGRSVAVPSVGELQP